MSTPDFPPAKHEVEDQLKRMLASPRFLVASNPSDFLRIGVERALLGKKTTGKVIAKAMFDGKYVQGESRDVRATSNNLRKLLSRYYEREGRNVVVVISYPEPSKDNTIKPVEGRAYTPLFSYNPKHPTHVELRLAYRSLEKGTYRDYRHAFRLFSGISEEQPDNIGAAMGLVETMLRCTEQHWPNPAMADPWEASKSMFERFNDRGQTYWRFWALKGYFHVALKDYDAALACYETALKLNSIATESYLPYLEFLILDLRRCEEGLGLAQRYVNERIEDSTAIANYGRLLCYAGQTQTGITHLITALAVDPGNSLAHEFLAIMRLIQKDVAGAVPHLRALKALCDPESFGMIVKFIEEHEEQLHLKGLTDDLINKTTNVVSVAIEKL